MGRGERVVRGMIVVEELTGRFEAPVVPVDETERRCNAVEEEVDAGAPASLFSSLLLVILLCCDCSVECRHRLVRALC